MELCLASSAHGLVLSVHLKDEKPPAELAAAALALHGMSRKRPSDNTGRHRADAPDRLYTATAICPARVCTGRQFFLRWRYVVYPGRVRVSSRFSAWMRFWNPRPNRPATATTKGALREVSANPNQVSSEPARGA